MQAIEKEEQISSVERDDAPYARSEPLSRIRVEIEKDQRTGVSFPFGPDAGHVGAARLDVEWRIVDARAGIERRRALSQLEGIERRSVASGDSQKLRIEPSVDLLTKGEHTPRGGDDDEKPRHRQSRPAMQPHPEGAAHRQNSMRIEPRNVRGAPTSTCTALRVPSG